MLCKNLRSPFKNNTLCCFLTAFESPNIILSKTKKHSLARMLSCFGGGWGIRTLVPVKANGFQDRLVMTTSIILRAYLVVKIPFCKVQKNARWVFAEMQIIFHNPLCIKGLENSIRIGPTVFQDSCPSENIVKMCAK